METKSAAPVALGAHPGAIRGFGLKSATSGPPEIVSIYTSLHMRAMRPIGVSPVRYRALNSCHRWW